MPYKDLEKRKKYHLDYYHRNKKILDIRSNKQEIKSKIKTKEYIKQYLLEHPCVDCGVSDTEILEFDHVRGVKEHAISTMKKHKVWKIQQEIEKCEVRCCNCHRKVTLQRLRLLRSGETVSH